jgi:hypothetical protein
VSTANLLASEAFNGTDKARIGIADDCFLNNKTDQGTYRASSVPKPTDPDSVWQKDRDYLSAESRYVPVGGETCTPARNVSSDDGTWKDRPACSGSPGPLQPGGRAVSELTTFHWTYLNADRPDVMDDGGLWQTGGCRQDIENRLGYRFVLISSKMGDLVTVYKNGRPTKRTVDVTLTVKNVGWTTPFKERSVFVTIGKDPHIQGLIQPMPLYGPRESVSGKAITDPRKWVPNQLVSFTVKVDVSYLKAGVQNLYLYMPDSARAQGIRLANLDMGNSDTVVSNRLKHTYTAPTPLVDPCAPSGCIYVTR